MRHFLTITDFSRAEITQVLSLAATLKKELKQGKRQEVLRGKTLAMIFQKPSNRTRISFEVGMYQLGGTALNIRPNEISMGEREPIADVAKVVSRYVDVVMVRLLRHDDVLEFAENATVPVINGLSDLFHPCQTLGDVQTIIEHKGTPEQVHLAYVGDGSNVCNSLIDIAETLSMTLHVATPAAYQPYRTTGLRSVHLTNDKVAAAAGADVVYTDVWTSMGQEKERAQRELDLAGFAVDAALMRKAKPDAIFMHCLPARRGEEVTTEVIDGPQSVIFDQAENRLHAQKALLAFLLGG